MKNYAGSGRARRIQGMGSKDDLRQQVAQVTLEVEKLQDNVQDLRNVFNELESQYAETGACCFPFKYIMLKDMVQDVADAANSLQHKFYGATDQSNDRKGSRGVVNRLLQNCQAFSANRQKLNRYEAIIEELGGMKSKDLEQVLEERQRALAQQKVLFSQLQDMLKQLQELHTQSQDVWLCARYMMLKRGVYSVLAAFSSVPGLSAEINQTSTQSSAGPSTGNSNNRQSQSRTRGK